MQPKINIGHCNLILLGTDETPFSQLCSLYSKTMNGAGTNEEEAIVLDDVISGNSGPIVPTPTLAARSSPAPLISVEEQQRALKTQEALLKHYKENMDKKPAAKQVSPENKKKRAVEGEELGMTQPKQGVETVTTIVETKTVRDENGNPTTIVTTTKRTTFGPPAPPPVIRAKLVRKQQPTWEQLEKEMNRTLNVCDYTHRIITDDPSHGPINYEIHESDVRFMHLEEVDEQRTEPPVYITFGDVESYKGIGHDGDVGDTCMNGCNECFLDACCEYLFGPYCYAAVKRYYNEHSYTATLRDAYVYYVAHFNRQLDLHSYKESGNSEMLRESEISKPTKCMKVGSLKYALKWVQWQQYHGPHSEHYRNERRKRDNLRRAKAARAQRDNRKTKL